MNGTIFILNDIFVILNYTIVILNEVKNLYFFNDARYSS